MFNHLLLGSNDLERSRKFYDAVLGVEGYEALPGRLVYSKDGDTLILGPARNGPATAANGMTLAFKMDSPEAVHAFHDAAVENGGTSIEDPPGLREFGGHRVYMAYLRDPDGHKLCATHPMSSD